MDNPGAIRCPGRQLGCAENLSTGNRVWVLGKDAGAGCLALEEMAPARAQPGVQALPLRTFRQVTYIPRTSVFSCVNGNHNITWNGAKWPQSYTEEGGQTGSRSCSFHAWVVESWPLTAGWLLLRGLNPNLMLFQ